MMERIKTIARRWQTMAAAAMFALAFGGLAYSQGFIIPNNSAFGGHYTVQGGTPVGVGCTMATTATDTDGTCTASAASGSITFSTPFLQAPFCLITDASATSTVSMPVYTISTTAITLTTIISTHVLFYHCAGRQGG